MGIIRVRLGSRCSEIVISLTLSCPGDMCRKMSSWQLDKYKAGVQKRGPGWDHRSQ